MYDTCMMRAHHAALRTHVMQDEDTDCGAAGAKTSFDQQQTQKKKMGDRRRRQEIAEEEVSHRRRRQEKEEEETVVNVREEDIQMFFSWNM